MNDFSSIRCVVFDLDDTLWPCEPTITNAELALYDWLAEHYPRITEQLSIEDLRVQRANFALHHTHISHDVTALRLHSMAELAQKYDYPVSLAKDGLAHFRHHRNQVNLFDDALPTLKALGEHFKIGSITNGNAQLDVIGVREHFDFVVTAEEAGAAKPNKKIFDFAREQIDLASHELLYVGDHPTNDVIGSKNSGWQALWFNPDAKQWSEEIQPNAQIQSLSELLELLRI
ncbi:MAG: HAD-IA family hydrolase [Gammaproteobacteria bacterium]|nr:HAD-IA family hydrolase [Gammaproteobacteria bacterium]